MDDLFQSVCFSDHILDKCGEPLFNIFNVAFQLDYLIFCLFRLHVIIIPRTFDDSHQTSLDCHFQAVHIYQLILSHVIVIFKYLIDLLPNYLNITICIW